MTCPWIPLPGQRRELDQVLREHHRADLLQVLAYSTVATSQTGNEQFCHVQRNRRRVEKSMGESDRAVRYVACQMNNILAGKAMAEGMTLKIAETIVSGFAGRTK